MEPTEKSEEITDTFIKIDRLKVWVPAVKSWWSRKARKSKNTVLNNVSVNIRTGEFVAIIGPSGAGKTTFLVSLAGKCTLPSTGIVTVNGTNVRDLAHGVVEMVPQFDVFMDSLSVMEHLVFMIEMKLGSVKKFHNRRVLRMIIEELQLNLLKDSLIGSLSGGERRLLSLASSLISNPQILICDEPTTGLDSSNASLVVGVLKKLSALGKVVICSVHQPSSDLFEDFNSICLMTEGKLVFHGTHEDCRKLFNSVNLQCPKNYNPAEFYVKAVSTESPDSAQLLERIIGNNTFLDSQEVIVTSHRASHYHTKICRRNWLKQVQLLLWRSSRTLKRNMKNFFIQLFVCALISSIIIETCYIGISGTTQRGIQDLRGFLWLMCSEVSFTLSYGALYAFESDLALFKREVGVYSASAFYVSRFLNMIPRCVIWPVCYVGISTLAVQLPNHLLTTCYFSAALVVMAIASTAYGLGMGALVLSTGVMADVMPCVDLPLFLMSGAFLRLSALPLWLQPVKYISHFYYGMDAISNIYWRQIKEIECPSNSTSICLKNGEAVLLQDGYSTNFMLEDGLGLLLVTIIWSVLGYLGLKREENKGYAY